MKAVVAILVIVVVLLLLGWVTFSRTGEDPNVSINTEQIEEDTEAAAETAQDLANKAAEKGGELVEKVQKTDIDVDVEQDATLP